MFNTDNVEINAAFYELFENVFNEDFFEVLTAMRPSNRIKALREKASKMVKVKEDGKEIEKKIIDMSVLDEDDQNALMEYNIKVGGKMKKYTPRIAYIGTLLHDRKYAGSYNGFMMFLASCDASDFLNPEISAKIWEKINIDQSVPKSAKNA